jgi:hypothetical protein
VLTEEQMESVQHHPVAASIGQDFLNACIGLKSSIDGHDLLPQMT